MPELPEVEALAADLDLRLRGHSVAAVGLHSFAALKTVDPPLEALPGRRLLGCSRRGKFLAIDADGVFLVVHLARAGWIRWHDRLPAEAATARRSPVAVRLRLDDGSGLVITEQGTEKRLALYAVRSVDDVPGVAALGVDPLSPDFDAERLAAILRAHSTAPLKGLLTDQSAIAGVGNAYSDEALHAARLSPFARAGGLDAAEAAHLHGALVGVLRDAVERSRGLPAAELKDEKRGGLRVHGRAGQPCPVCGDPVREVSFASRSFQYCPGCQTGGKILADRRLSRLLR